MKFRFFQKCPHCMKKAFEYKSKPSSGQRLTAENVIHKDNPKAGDPIVCQECKKPFPFEYFNGDKLITEQTL